MLKKEDIIREYNSLMRSYGRTDNILDIKGDIDILFLTYTDDTETVSDLLGRLNNKNQLDLTIDINWPKKCDYCADNETDEWITADFYYNPRREVHTGFNGKILIAKKEYGSNTKLLTIYNDLITLPKIGKDYLNKLKYYGTN